MGVEPPLKVCGEKAVRRSVNEGHGKDEDDGKAGPGDGGGRGASHSPWVNSDPRSSHWNYASCRPPGPKMGVQMRIQFWKLRKYKNWDIAEVHLA